MADIFSTKMLGLKLWQSTCLAHIKPPPPCHPQPLAALTKDLCISALITLNSIMNTWVNTKKGKAYECSKKRHPPPAFSGYLLRPLPVVDAKDVLQIRGILRNRSRKAQPVTSLVREKLSSKPSPWQKVVASDTNLRQRRAGDSLLYSYAKVLSNEK